MFSMDHIAVAILMGLSSFLSIRSVPEDSSGWTTVKHFNTLDGHPSYIATNSEIATECRLHPDQNLIFPVIIHGSHQLYTDGKLIESFGDPTFQVARSFYGAPIVPCKKIIGGSELRWEVTSYSRYFARFKFFPRVAAGGMERQFIQETMNAVAAGNLFFLAFMFIVIFGGRISQDLKWSFVLSNAFFSVYFICCAPSLFGLQVGMLNVHKVADSSLWMGVFFLFRLMKKRELIGERQLIVYTASGIIAMLCIVTGRTGDIIQFGTMIPFVPFFAIMTISLTNLLKKLVRYGIKSEAAWQILSLGSFTSMALNDALTVTGLVESPMVLSIGIVGSSAFIGLDLNRKILSIYSEIEYLRANLEVEVERKTLELKAAQAEMISNAKMASLGTLSAGIAHEINNSLNYVRGSLAPLTKIIKAAVDFDGKTKALGLLQVMEEGLTVTFAIMTSLRTYSGLNHAKVKEYVLTDLVKSILNILRSKIPEFITIELAIPDDLRVEVNGAGLNQVLMNLIVNGIDAIQSKNTTQESPGKICISASPDGDGGVRIYVKDTGPGIPTDIIGKIFDPFFTTKDVGKGTGLGLHICRAEVARHKGTLTVKSEVGAGAEFIIHIPRHHGSDSLGAMAA